MGSKSPEHVVVAGIPPGDCEINVGKTEHGVAYIQVKARSSGDASQLFDFVRYRMGMTKPDENLYWDSVSRHIRQKVEKVPKPKHK